MHAVPVSQRSLSYFWNGWLTLIMFPIVEKKRSVVDADSNTGVFD